VNNSRTQADITVPTLVATDNPPLFISSSSTPVTSNLTAAAEILSTLDGSKCLNDIFQALNISEMAFISPARFREVNSKQNNSLLIMVQSHQAMSQLLVSMGQPSHKDDPHGTSTTTYPGGLNLSTKNILLELGWTQASYA